MVTMQCSKCAERVFYVTPLCHVSHLVILLQTSAFSCAVHYSVLTFSVQFAEQTGEMKCVQLNTLVQEGAN